jgi:hypothetical protein
VYADLGYREGDLPVAEAVSRRILPLPIYPELTDEQVDYVIAMIRQFFKQETPRRSRHPNHQGRRSEDGGLQSE